LTKQKENHLQTVDKNRN